MTEGMVPRKFIERYWKYVAAINGKAITQKEEKDKLELQLSRDLCFLWLMAVSNYQGVTVKEFARKFDKTIPNRNFKNHTTYALIFKLIKLGTKEYGKMAKAATEEENKPVENQK